ncbi:hypothetical protein N1Z36_00015635 [Pseudomonas aeruginosa]
MQRRYRGGGGGGGEKGGPAAPRPPPPLRGGVGLLWLIERGGDEYPAKLPLSDKGATEPRRH